MLLGAVTHVHIMVKGLSRDKLGTVNYYSRKLYHGYLPRLISVFTQLFSRETRQGLLERARFSVLKAVDIQNKKKKNDPDGPG